MEVPVSSSRHHLSNDDHLDNKGEVIRTVLCYVVYDSCAQQYAHVSSS